MTRFAAYFAPAPDSALGRFGAALLGRDAFTGLSQPPLLPLPESVLAEPARYGFHATLKAPFRLREGWDPAALRRTRTAWRASAPTGRTAAPLTLAAIGLWLALVPEGPEPLLDALHRHSLALFEPLRAPLTEADRARRLKTPLSPREQSLLELWGYPHVLEAFRFHLTLAGPFADPEAQAQAEALIRAALPDPAPLAIGPEDLHLFIEGPDRRFTVLA